MVSDEKFDLVVAFNDDLEFNGELQGMVEIEKVLHGCNIYIKETEYFDVVTVELLDDKDQAITKLKDADVKYVKKAVPIDRVVKSNTSEIEKEVYKLIKRNAKKGESFRLDCDFRNKRYIQSQEELVNNILNRLCNDFELVPQEPNWIVEIEEVGPYTGVAILKPNQIITPKNLNK